MAAVTPSTTNRCKGTNADATANIQLYCYAGDDSDGDPTYRCATWRKFRVQCPKLTGQCSNKSEAYVAAITVCNQRLF